MKRATQKAGAEENTGPPKYSIGVIGWMKKNLFNTWYNVVLTFFSLWVLYHIILGFFNWSIRFAVFRGDDPETCRGIDGACWLAIKDMWELFMVGLYPYEERYRPLLVLVLVIAVSAMFLFSAVRRRRWFHLSWLILAVVVFYIIRGNDALGMPKVDTNLWGGLLLTVMLSVVGIAVASPISIMLALGRRSRMPIIRALCVGYIELIRGVPLITILFMASVMLPLFFAEGFHLDKLLRAQIGIILFASAYQAEVVRGGLQGVASGQEEAAAAVGLNYWQTMTFIIMPQALRIVIPPMVSQFISLLKDTSLVAIIGLYDLLGVSGLVSSNPKWIGKVTEGYVFVALIFWIMCFSMSRYAVKLEGKYDTGKQ